MSTIFFLQIFEAKMAEKKVEEKLPQVLWQKGFGISSYMGVSENNGTPQIIYFNRVFPS